MRAIRDERPGLNPARLVRLMRESIDRCALKLDGMTVLTEAATGAYAVTPVLAAMAGARRVYAVTKATRYGTVDEVAAETSALAVLAGVADRIDVCTEKAADRLREADIVTNSGHLRPLDRGTLTHMRTDAVIPLMYEAWEFRPSDVELDECHQRGILVGGTNERHPAVDVFSYLGIMAVKLLLDAGVSVHHSRILLLSDNGFSPYIEAGLTAAGATVVTMAQLGNLGEQDGFDAVLVALKPRSAPVLAPHDLNRIAAHSPGAVLAQYWGDLDRDAVRAAGLPVWPQEAPAVGHMAILPAGIGPEATVRLQCGGLKAGEVLRNRSFATDPSAAAFVELM